MSSSPVRVVSLTGAALQTALPDLARLRITVFRKWPYLYDGALAYEERYLARFAATERSVIVAAFDGETIIGAATASPIGGHVPEFSAPLEMAGLPVDRIFYFGESVLLPEYRGQGIGHAFLRSSRSARTKIPRVSIRILLCRGTPGGSSIARSRLPAIGCLLEQARLLSAAWRHQFARLEGHRARRGDAEVHALLDQGVVIFDRFGYSFTPE